MGRPRNSNAPVTGVPGEVVGEAAPPASESQQGETNPTADSEPNVPDTTGATPPASESQQRHELQGVAVIDTTPPALNEAKTKRIINVRLKGKKIIAGKKLIAFDANGTAELEAADADRLLTIPGYKEVII
jgi:hypothetical protein